MFVPAELRIFIPSYCVDVVKKPPEVKEIKGSIQNHLTWSVKGECFFVQPYSNGTVYLIRVEDCDKDIKK